MQAPPLKLVLLMPVFDDWPCARLMIQKLDAALAASPVTARVLLVDDGSPTQPAAPFLAEPLKTLCGVERLRLRRNLGHQRAIAIGLSFLAAERDCDAVLVLDADGEDSPDDVPRLIQKFLELNGTHVVFAERAPLGAVHLPPLLPSLPRAHRHRGRSAARRTVRHAPLH